jgi:hypothetical protein
MTSILKSYPSTNRL